MAKFTNPKQQQIYDLYLKNPPTLSSGNGLIVAYWRGRNNPVNSPYVRGSLAHAAWRAGRKTRDKGVN